MFYGIFHKHLQAGRDDFRLSFHVGVAADADLKGFAETDVFQIKVDFGEAHFLR